MHLMSISTSIFQLYAPIRTCRTGNNSFSASVRVCGLSGRDIRVCVCATNAQQYRHLGNDHENEIRKMINQQNDNIVHR